MKLWITAMNNERLHESIVDQSTSKYALFSHVSPLYPGGQSHVYDPSCVILHDPPCLQGVLSHTPTITIQRKLRKLDKKNS